jgi:hypothetical protein
MALLKKKLDSMKTSAGVPCQLGMCYFPQGMLENFPYKSIRNFWKEVCLKDQIYYLDLTDDFLVTRLTYFPFSEAGGQIILIRMATRFLPNF